MKPELINLLHRLEAHPGIEGFQNLVIFKNGTANATYRHGAMKFDSLEALESFAYQQEEGCNVTLPPAAQAAPAASGIATSEARL